MTKQWYDKPKLDSLFAGRTPSPAIVATSGGNAWMGLKTPDAIFGNNEQVCLAGTPPALKLAAMPFTLAQGFKASAMAIWVQTAVAGGFIRPAIYSANPTTGLPYQLVWDGGALTTDAIGVKTVTGNVDLPVGRYWTVTALSDSGIKVCTHHYNHSQPTPYYADTTAFDTRASYHSATNHNPSTAMPADLSSYGFSGVWAAALGPAAIQAKIASLL